MPKPTVELDLFAYRDDRGDTAKREKPTASQPKIQLLGYPADSRVLQEIILTPYGARNLLSKLQAALTYIEGKPECFERRIDNE